MRTIIIDTQNEVETKYKISPIRFYDWQKELLKRLAYFLSENVKKSFTEEEYNTVVEKQTQEKALFLNEDYRSFPRLLQKTMDDGNYMLCWTTNEKGQLTYSFSQWKMQEAFTAMRIIEIDKEQQIASLKKFFQNYQEMRGTIKQYLTFFVESEKNEGELKEILIQACNDLQYLFQFHIIYFELLEGITNINTEGKITALNLIGKEIRDLKPLRNLTQLQELDLSWNEITDIRPLGILTQLQELSLGENKITDLRPLEKLTPLHEHKLWWNEIGDLTPSEKQTQLPNLNLGGNKITDLTPLRKLTQLRELSLGGNKITDLTPLRKLTQLRELSLGENKITDLTPLENLTRLKKLYLDWNKITDLTPLGKLTQLQDLSLIANKITDIRPLGNLMHLKKLHLGWNKITDLTPLRKLMQLQKLSIRKGKITDLTLLGKLMQLQDLDLEENEITNLAPLEKLKQLKKLDLLRNKTSSLDISSIVFHEELINFSMDWNIQLFCKEYLINQIICPALLAMKDRIRPI